MPGAVCFNLIHVRENKVKNAVSRKRETFRKLERRIIVFWVYSISNTLVFSICRQTLLFTCVRPLGAREEVFPEPSLSKTIHKHYIYL